jgi:hypothetical protein
MKRNHRSKLNEFVGLGPKVGAFKHRSRISAPNLGSENSLLHVNYFRKLMKKKRKKNEDDLRSVLQKNCCSLAQAMYQYTDSESILGRGKIKYSPYLWPDLPKL